jgi:DNA-binding protein HU-beta
MTKNELSEGIAQRVGLAGTEARRALDAVVDLISDELASGGEVSIAGFGKFSVSNRAARQGRNPATGATIQIAASRSAKFSPAKALKDRLN